MERLVQFQQVEGVVKRHRGIVYFFNSDTKYVAIASPVAVLFLHGKFRSIVMDELDPVRPIGIKRLDCTAVAAE